MQERARVRIAPEPTPTVVRPYQSIRRYDSALRRSVQRDGDGVRRRTATGGQPPLSQCMRGMYLKNDKRMSLHAAPQLLSEIAALAVRAHDRAEFRSGTLALLQGVIPFEVAFVQSGASTAGPEPVSWGLPPLAGGCFARRADTVWSELAGIRAAALGTGRGGRGLGPGQRRLGARTTAALRAPAATPLPRRAGGGPHRAGDGPRRRALHPAGARAGPPRAARSSGSATGGRARCRRRSGPGSLRASRRSSTT